MELASMKSTCRNHQLLNRIDVVEKFGPDGNKRTGDVTPMEGDYKIGQMEDVYTAGPQDKDALCYENSSQT